MRVMSSALCIGLSCLASAGNAEEGSWTLFPLTAAGQASSDPAGLWRADELAEGAGPSSVIRHGEIPLASGLLIVSYLEDGSCGLQDCLLRVALLGPDERRMPAAPLSVCQSPETLEFNFVTGGLRLCGKELPLDAAFATAEVVPLQGGGAHPVFGHWGDTRQCDSAGQGYFETHVITAESIDSDYMSCRHELRDGGSGAWSGDAVCPYENEPAAEFILGAISFQDKLFLNWTSYKDGALSTQTLYRCPAKG